MQTVRVLSETVIRAHQRHRLAGKPHKCTLYRWRKRGTKHPVTGYLVTLEWAYLGGEPVTSLEAYDRFMRQLNGEVIEGLSNGECERSDKMPVVARKIGGKWRIVEAASGRIAMTPRGKPRDGGGHASKEKALAQVRAMNSDR